MISIIVPVYNASKTLNRCIESVLSQTFTEFEVLLINDGSTDDSGQICEKFSKHDSRVRVFHIANSGVSSARNYGLDLAKGDWITFVDSDDWLDEAYLEKLYIDNLSAVDLVISYGRNVCNYSVVQEILYQDQCISVNEVPSLFLKYDLAWQTSPWAKLYSKDIIADLRFIEGMHIGEDLVFLYSYIMKCDTIYVVGTSYYNYDVSNVNTLTRRIGNFAEESYAYRNVLSILDKVIDRFKISDKMVLKKMAWIKSYYTHRVLNSLYHTKTMSRTQRYHVILGLDINNYIANIEHTSIKESILCWLLSARMFKVYDFLRIIVSKVKR